MNIEPPKQPNQLTDKDLAAELPAGANINGPLASNHLPAPADPANNNHTSRKKSKKGEGWRSILSTILLVAFALFIAFGIAAYGVQSYEVDGSSMETTLQNHDRLIVDKIPRTLSRLTHHSYVPNRGDIIVFNQTGLFDARGLAEKQLIKRVIGLPGDRVVVGGGKITIYDATHPRGFNPDTAGKYRIAAPITPTNVDIALQPGYIFVCGDNRTNSEDSRYFGPVKVNQIVGKLVLRITPLNKVERF